MIADVQESIKSPKHQNLRDTLATTLPESCSFFLTQDKTFSSINNGLKAMKFIHLYSWTTCNFCSINVESKFRNLFVK